LSAWETFEHEADVGLVVRGRDGPDLFANAGIALFSLVCELDRVVPRERHELAGRAGAADTLLVAWLNDLVYLFEAEGVVCSRFEFAEWSETAYRAHALGEPADPERHDPRDLVKAATYHGLALARTQEGFEARVILDV
jgi:SHS2 domain-containing protein